MSVRAPGDPSSPSSTSILRDFTVIVLILLAGVALRFYHLDASSLWSDEGNSWALIQRGFAQISQDAARDIHPPGYYWLLKLWSAGAGVSAEAMRAFSALLGVLLVAVTYAIGRTLARIAGLTPAVAPLAAFITALSPFQIYYSQEARMYLLLALEAALLGWAAIQLLEQQARAEARLNASAQIVFVFAAICGLWTHYSFPFVLLAADLAFFWQFMIGVRSHPQRQRRLFVHLIGLNLLAILAFLPWLSTALHSVLNWPQGGDYVAISGALARAVQTLFFGAIRETPQPLWPWLLLLCLLVGAGILATARTAAGRLLTFWALIPIALLLALGLTSDAFYKLLLLASPAWTLLIAAAVTAERTPRAGRTVGQIGVCALVALAAYATLPGYYSDPHARDNYAGIARFLSVMATPDDDLLILNAPGQQDVWEYYDPGIEVLALPQERPARAEPTIAALAAAVGEHRRIHAIYWATDESDPDAIVERWLEENSYKGAESWQGDIRFVTYHVAAELPCRSPDRQTLFGPQIELVEVCGLTPNLTVTAGDVLLAGLRWRAPASIAQSYAVSVQVLNQQGQVVAQHDGIPGGGGAPTDRWVAGEIIADNHGVHIPIGTPPGLYDVALVLYDPAGGERLMTATGALLSLAAVEIVPGAQTLPLDLLPVQQLVDRALGPVRLAGYSMYRQGFAHAPQSPVAAGDAVEFVLYWQAPDPLPPAWPQQMEVTLRLGDSVHTQPLAGAGYPSGQWRGGELVRTVIVVPYDGHSSVPSISVDGDTLRLARLPLR